MLGQHKRLGKDLVGLGGSSFGVIANLVYIGMTSKRSKDCVTTFKAFTRVISMKLDMSKTTSSKAY